jgi:glycosyltransferase involved in cell wall biosynthesis
MVVAVVIPDRLGPEEYAYFIEQSFRNLAAQFPMHRFCFFGSADQHILLPQIQWIKKPGSRNFFSRWWWYHLRLPHELKKINADILIGTEAVFCPQAPCPQSVVLPNGFFHLPGRGLGRPNISPIKKAEHIAVFRQEAKEWLVQGDRLPTEKVSLIPVAVATHFAALPYEEMEAVRAQYTAGAAYFLCTGISELTWVLKAFSRFRKRQKSSLRLVVLCPTDARGMEQQLARYRFRQDVVLLHNLEAGDESRLYGAAYALIDGGAHSRIPLIKALQCQVPLLTCAANRLFLGEAGLYFDPEDSLQLSEQMMLVYKDENLRTRMIENGFPLAAQHSWENCTRSWWQCITAAISK